MDTFRWDTCFITGLEVVDQQHHQLVDIINQFGELLQLPKGATTEETERLFGELASYSRDHFEEEDGLMVRYGVDPDHVARHRKEHTRFVQDITTLHAGMSSENSKVAQQLFNHLSNWLAFHMLGTDQLMTALISAAKAGTSAEDGYLAYQKSRDPASATLVGSISRQFEQTFDSNRSLFDSGQTLETCDNGSAISKV